MTIARKLLAFLALLCFSAAALAQVPIYTKGPAFPTAPGTPANPIKITVLGASESARSAMADKPWPTRLGELINEGGSTNTTIDNLGYHGATFFQANTVTTVYGTKTMVQEAITGNPDVVFVGFGGNDVMNNADSRYAAGVATIKSDADTLFTALRAGLPNALIIAILPRAHDNTNFATPGTTLKNKAIASQFMETMTVAGTANLWTNEMLETGVSAGGVGGTGGKNKVADLEVLTAYLSAGSGNASANIIGVNWIRMDFWKLQRLGCTLPDQAHHNVGCQQWQAASVYKQAKTLTAFTAKFPRLSNQIIADWQDPDAFFTHYLTSSGDGWVRAAGADVPGLNGGDMNRFWGDQTLFSPEEWYLPSKARVTTWPLPGGTLQNSSEWDGTFRLVVRGGPPTQLAYLSIDAAAWVSSGESTDTHGNFETTIRTGVFGLGTGSHTLRFKIGTESYGPYTYTISAPFNESKFSTAANTTAFTMTTAQMVGSRQVVLKLTGALGAGANLTTETAANIIAAIPNAYVGQTYRLKIINANAAAFAWTVTAGAGVTLSGTLHTVTANAWREYEVKYTGTGAITLESIGTGTWS